LPGTGWDVIGEDAAAGAAGAGCASAAAGSVSSATMAVEARWFDRIVVIESFLRLRLSPIWKRVVAGHAPDGRGGQAAQ